MQEKIIGIYKITNKITNECYIGQSRNILKRWQDHYYKLDTDRTKNLHLYRAFKKYGFENFNFEIIEKCSIEQLNEKEVYWIQYYDSYNNGYNLTPGGDYSSSSQRVATRQEVIEIRKRELNYDTFSNVCKDYPHLSKSIIKGIWEGQTYNDIYVEGFTEENRRKAMKIVKQQESAKRKNSQMTKELILQIRTDKKNGMKRKDGYQKYKNYFKSLGGFDSIWYSQRWKDIQPK